MNVHYAGKGGWVSLAGTARFVDDRAKLRELWDATDGAFMEGVAAKSALLRGTLDEIAAEHAELGLTVRGRGLFMGLVCDSDPTWAGRVSAEAFRRGLVIETSGANDQVLKFLTALTITEDELTRGLQIVRESIAAVLAG